MGTNQEARGTKETQGTQINKEQSENTDTHGQINKQNTGVHRKKGQENRQRLEVDRNHGT